MENQAEPLTKPDVIDEAMAACNDPKLFEELAQLFLKERGGRLGIEASREDLKAVCQEVRAYDASRTATRKR